ncbi:MAG: hypothetical protein MK105_17465 [Crocinitomicaceae bacterium]|nr:hypothetical protein [Crocinitomicaceae bacterium]
MKLFLLTAILISIGCSDKIDDKLKEQIEINPDLHKYQNTDGINQSKDPYTINFDANNQTKELTIKIDLDEGSYYIAPNSPGTFKGLLKINFPANDFFELASTFVSAPEPIEEENQWGEGLVEIIRETTVHSMRYKLKSTGDFQIQGTVQFVIEPKCTLEKIPVTIFSKDGQLSFVRNGE